jgi:hypothetical protein
LASPALLLLPQMLPQMLLNALLVLVPASLLRWLWAGARRWQLGVLECESCLQERADGDNMHGLGAGTLA